MPLTTKDYPAFPFTSAGSAVASPRLESFHLTVGNLRCFDARVSTQDEKIHFNWWDRNNKFSAGAKRAPPYTEIFWILFFKAAANMGDMSKDILDASTPEEIEALRTKTVKVHVEEDGEICTKEIKMISPAMRAMIDNICYMAVYGHTTMLNSRVPANRTLAFTEFALKVALDNEVKFFEGWKSYRAAHPVVKEDAAAENDSETERIMKLLGDGDDDEPPGADSEGGAKDGE